MANRGKCFTLRKLLLAVFGCAIVLLFIGSLLRTFIAFYPQPDDARDVSIYRRENEPIDGSDHFHGHHGGDKKPKFIYLIQTEICLPQEILDPEFLGSPTLCSCEVIVLSYKSLCLNNGHLHVQYTFDEISWSKGRNRLYEMAKKRDFGQVLYYMFLDDDLKLIFNDFAPRAFHARAPARMFEEFLVRHEPAIGVPDYNVHHGAGVMISKRNKLCGRTVTNRTPLYVPTIHFDASFTAIHRNASDHLLPYPTEYDNKCYWHSQRYMIAAAEIQFRGQVVMFTSVQAINTQHREYPRDDSGTGGAWAHFLEDLIRKVPAAHRDEKMLKEFQANPEKYIENSLSVCLNVPPKYPIEPFRHFTWNVH